MAFVLHRYPYRETSVIVDLFSSQHGRINVIAKGVRSAKSRLKGVLHPFIALQISAQGKSSLKTLTSADPVGKPFCLEGTAFMSSLYINEMLTRLLHKEEAHPELFASYQSTLQTLSGGGDISIALRLFESHLLDSLGYALSFYYTAGDHQKIVEGNHYRFIVEHGFVSINDTENKNEVNIFFGRDLLAIAQHDFSCKETLQAAKRLFYLALKPLLGNKPLKSREILQSIVREN